MSRRDDHTARRQGHDLRVEPFEVRDRGRDVVRERERGLEEAREPRGAVRVADVALDRRQPEVGAAAVAERADDARDLDRVADLGRRRVQFQ